VIGERTGVGTDCTVDRRAGTGLRGWVGEYAGPLGHTGREFSCGGISELDMSLCVHVRCFRPAAQRPLSRGCHLVGVRPHTTSLSSFPVISIPKTVNSKISGERCIKNCTCGLWAVGGGSAMPHAWISACSRHATLCVPPIRPTGAICISYTLWPLALGEYRGTEQVPRWSGAYGKVWVLELLNAGQRKPCALLFIRLKIGFVPSRKEGPRCALSVD